MFASVKQEQMTLDTVMSVHDESLVQLTLLLSFIWICQSMQFESEKYMAIGFYQNVSQRLDLSCDLTEDN